jgi:hypothetical protein
MGEVFINNSVTIFLTCLGAPLVGVAGLIGWVLLDNFIRKSKLKTLKRQLVQTKNTKVIKALQKEILELEKIKWWRVLELQFLKTWGKRK